MTVRFPRWPFVILAAWLVLAVAASMLPGDPLSPRGAAGAIDVLAAPSAAHWLGTDDIGRDVFSRLAYGARTSLALGLGAAIVATLLGTLAGVVAARRPRTTLALGVACDLVAALPALVLVIALRGLVGGGALALVVVIALRPASDLARLVAATIDEALAAPYVDAARALGATPARLRFVHALPAAWPFVAVAFAETLATAALAEAALGFLGLGLAAPTPSWGELLAQAHRNGMALHLALPAGLAVTLVALAASRVADAFAQRT